MTRTTLSFWLCLLGLLTTLGWGCGQSSTPGGEADSGPGEQDSGPGDDGGGDTDAGDDGGGDTDAGDDAGPASCARNDECLESEYCAFKEGCAGEGRCAERPYACLPVVQEVCGCDDTTYGTACEAASAGVNVAREGACTTYCQSSAECGEGEYCHTTGCRASGRCEALPSCALEIPVCGCDGVTYDTVCDAAEAEALVVGEGPCEGTGEGCATNDDCVSSDQFCKKRSCGAATGTCEPRPSCGIVADPSGPVCDCDGNTHADANCAQAAGHNIDHSGACEDAERACRTNRDCGRAEYCAAANDDGSSRGFCEAEGVCERRPNIDDDCGGIGLPVQICGCDGKTYASECHANAAGVRAGAGVPGCDDEEPGPVIE